MDQSDPILGKRSYWNFSVWALLEDYGWYLLLIAVIFVSIYRRAKPTIDKYFKDQADREYSAKYHKDPDLAAARLAAQEAVALKLQEKYRKDAEEYQQKMEQKDLKKREEWLAKHGDSGGQVLGSSSKTTQQQSLKPEYNPLTGDSSSHSYRPQRRSPCSGGGCGR